jgi:Tol biopolymer transport system component
MSGAKPSFSFDERFIVTHHYEGGKADVFLVDLTTGQRVQVTDMPAGTYAQFPHFRSDGWIYFLVTGGEKEYVAASDAALRL